MRRKQRTQTLLSQAISLKRSGTREDMADLARVKEELDRRRTQLFLRCLVIAAAIVALLGALVALIAVSKRG